MPFEADIDQEETTENKPKRQPLPKVGEVQPPRSTTQRSEQEAVQIKPSKRPDVTDVVIPSTVEFLEVKDLPSKFMPYPKGTRVLTRPYTYGEVININESHLTLVDQIQRVAKGIQVFGIDNALELTMFDFLYLGLKRKLDTLGATDFMAVFMCRNPQCGHADHVQLTTADLNFDYIKAKDLPITIKDFPGLGNCTFSPMTMRQFLEMMETEKDDTISMMARQCINQDPVRAYNAFFTATGQWHRDLKRVDDYLFHGLASIEVECKECKRPTPVMLDGWEAVIIPFRGQDEPDEGSIVFGDTGGDTP